MLFHRQREVVFVGTVRVFSYSPTCKIRIEQARDLHEINKGRLATAEAFPVLVKYRLKMTGESSEQITMDPPHIYVERTLAIIKPDALHKSEEIQDIILRSGFAILQVREHFDGWGINNKCIRFKNRAKV